LLSEIKLLTYTIVNSLSDNHFYSLIASFFTTKENVTNQSKISLRDGPLNEEFSSKTNRNENSATKSTGNSKISE